MEPGEAERRRPDGRTPTRPHGGRVGLDRSPGSQATGAFRRPWLLPGEAPQWIQRGLPSPSCSNRGAYRCGAAQEFHLLPEHPARIVDSQHPRDGGGIQAPRLPQGFRSARRSGGWPAHPSGLERESLPRFKGSRITPRQAGQSGAGRSVDNQAAQTQQLRPLPLASYRAWSVRWTSSSRVSSPPLASAIPQLAVI